MNYRFVAAKKEKKKPLTGALSWRALVGGPLPDTALLFCVFGLLVFGWVMVYSSSAIVAEARYHDQFFFLKRQILWSAIGLVAFVSAANIPVSFWQPAAKPAYAVTCFLLMVVLAIGPRISGARRWIHLPGFGLQPSEIAKVILVFVAADYLDRKEGRITEFKRGLLPLLLIAGFMIGLIVIEPDLGTPVLMTSVLCALIFLSGGRWAHFLIMGAAAVPLLVLAVFKVRYRLQRFFAYLDPWSDAKGKGYQLIQSLIALGSGGFFGRGLGESRAKLSSLPDCHTDFIFSILGEELGLAGTLACAALFLFLCLRGLSIAKNAKSPFSKLVAAGLSLTIGFQALINMGVASGLFPTKGMPLPFISFGGSSLVITLFSAGLLASISRENAAGESRE